MLTHSLRMLTQQNLLFFFGLGLHRLVKLVNRHFRVDHHFAAAWERDDHIGDERLVSHAHLLLTDIVNAETQADALSHVFQLQLAPVSTIFRTRENTGHLLGLLGKIGDVLF